MPAFQTTGDSYYESIMYYLPNPRSLHQYLRKHRTALTILLFVVLTSLVYLFVRVGGLHLKRPIYVRPKPMSVVSRDPQFKQLKPYNEPLKGARPGRLSLLNAAPEVSNQKPKQSSVYTTSKVIHSDLQPGYFEVQKLQKKPAMASIQKIVDLSGRSMKYMG